MSYLALTDADREAMLETIGVSSVEELFADLPAGVRLGRELELPPAMSEQELNAYFESLAAENAHVGAELSFLGAGMYDHYVPAIVDAVLQRGELLTAYTPYQPELSQGVLQAIFEYQTAICELTGMDVSNASGYDGTTVAADACFIAKHATGRSKVVVTEATNPQVRQVVKTFAPGFGLEVVEVPHRDGATDPDELREAAADAACVIFQHPNFFGVLEPAPELAAAANEAEALPVAHVDPLSLGVLEPPGNYGCAIAIGEGQAAGNYLSYRRAALRVPRGTLRVHPADARTDRRRDDRRRGEPRLRPHPPDARAAHQAREGDLEHHHQPDAAGAGRARLPLVARAGGAPGGRGDLHEPRRAREGAARAPARVCRSANIQGVCGARRTARAGGRPRGPRAGRASRLPARPRLPGDGRRAAGGADREADAGARSTGWRRCSRREADLREVATRPARRPACRGPRGFRRPRFLPSSPAPSRRACPSSPSRTCCATSPSSRRGTSGSTPASTRSAPAR